MKKWIMSFVIILAFSFSACGGKDDNIRERAYAGCETKEFKEGQEACRTFVAAASDEDLHILARKGVLAGFTPEPTEVEKGNDETDRSWCELEQGTYNSETDECMP